MDVQSGWREVCVARFVLGGERVLDDDFWG